MFKFNSRNTRIRCDMFRVYNKGTRTTLLTLLWCLNINFDYTLYFIPFSSISILLTLNRKTFLGTFLHGNNFECRFMWYPVDICLLQVNNRNTRRRCEICSKLTIKTPERRQWSMTSFWCLYC